jgi:pimeloyl-ACP methyl ester carboxylesterase
MAGSGISAIVRSAKVEDEVPYADNAGVRVHYQIEGTGPALVLQHGFTQCLEDWVECGYVAALQSKYRLVLIDARGHGRSDKPHDEASYALEHRVADVTSVLDAVGIERAHFWGYSMGGFIGFGMARHASRRLNALVIGGSHPLARKPEVLLRWVREMMNGGDDALVPTFEKMAGPISISYAARLRAADLEAYLACVANHPGMEDMLAAVAIPCCLYCGDADPIFTQAKLASELIPNARFLALPRLSHLPAFVESNIALPPVMQFLEATL